MIVDEFHHAEAPTYARLLEHVAPRYLIGLTATPERTDGVHVRRWFDDRVASEMRLWDALDEQLLAPLQYFGVADDVDLSGLEWRRGGYVTEELEAVYTGNDARTAKVLTALREIVGDPGGMRGFGFCVSVAHARYMAEKFTAAGIPARAITGETPGGERRDTLAALQRGELRVVFGVDVLTEGVDVPEVDTILLLRPTESVTVFMQQIGRGLRRHPAKPCCTVRDFIGQQRREFRFDLRLRVLTGSSRGAVIEQVEKGFPYLPSGCSISLDRQATEIVLSNLRTSLRLGKPALVSELQRMRTEVADPDLAGFLRWAGVERADLARPSVGGWVGLRGLAGLPVPPAGPDEERLARALWRWLHADDPERLGMARRLAAGPSPDWSAMSPPERRLAKMVHVWLWTGRDAPESLPEGIERLHRHPARARQLVELAGVLEEAAMRVTRPLSALPGGAPFATIPLHLHAAYSRDEILAAIGALTPGRRYSHQAGVYYDPDSNIDALYVSVHKTERHYSPTTMYRDYPISRELFHWESQSTTRPSSPTGQRYLDGSSHVLLFARSTRTTDRGALPLPRARHVGRCPRRAADRDHLASPPPDAPVVLRRHPLPGRLTPSPGHVQAGSSLLRSRKKRLFGH